MALATGRAMLARAGDAEAERQLARALATLPAARA
jgi:hypothetical protein